MYISGSEQMSEAHDLDEWICGYLDLWIYDFATIHYSTVFTVELKSASRSVGTTKGYFLLGLSLEGLYLVIAFQFFFLVQEVRISQYRHC